MGAQGDSVWGIENIPMAVAKTNLSRIAMQVNATGEPVVVSKRSQPWFEIRPLAYRGPDGIESSVQAEESTVFSA